MPRQHVPLVKTRPCIPPRHEAPTTSSPHSRLWRVNTRTLPKGAAGPPALIFFEFNQTARKSNLRTGQWGLRPVFTACPDTDESPVLALIGGRSGLRARPL